MLSFAYTHTPDRLSVGQGCIHTSKVNQQQTPAEERASRPLQDRQDGPRPPGQYWTTQPSARLMVEQTAATRSAVCLSADMPSVFRGSPVRTGRRGLRKLFPEIASRLLAWQFRKDPAAYHDARQMKHSYFVKEVSSITLLIGFSRLVLCTTSTFFQTGLFRSEITGY